MIEDVCRYCPYIEGECAGPLANKMNRLRWVESPLRLRLSLLRWLGFPLVLDGFPDHALVDIDQQEAIRGIFLLFEVKKRVTPVNIWQAMTYIIIASMYSPEYKPLLVSCQSHHASLPSIV